MGSRRSDDNLISTSSSSSDTLQWQKVFNALVQMVHSQQSQLETLANDRKLLEDRIQIQHQRWLSDVHLLEDHVSLLKNNLRVAEMSQLLEAAKWDLVVGMKLTEGFFYKSISEQSGSDLEDMQQVIDCLSSKLLEQKDKSEGKTRETDKSKGGEGYLRTTGNIKEEEKRTKALRDEIRRLKHANEKQSSERNSEVSALVAERNFVWNQMKKMESHYTSLLKSKRVEVEQGNENIVKLQQCVEKLQSSNQEKDDDIVKLKAEISKLELDMGTRNKEISKLCKELEFLRSSRKASPTPIVTRPRQESSNCRLKSASNGVSEKRNPVNKESSESQASRPSKTIDKGSKRSLKRRGMETESKLETPKLFTSGFKVPKLKIYSSPLV